MLEIVHYLCTIFKIDMKKTKNMNTFIKNCYCVCRNKAVPLQPF
jgi:hypothetical protein